MTYRLVHRGEISDETHEITFSPAPDGLVMATIRPRTRWERFRRRLMGEPR